MRADLRGHAVRSGAVSLGAQLLLGGVGVASAAVLARLLTPRDFGLIAMASSLSAFVKTFRDFGLPLATVHREDINHLQVSALFWVNLGLNALIALLMAALAPVLAWFYGEPRLTAITLVVSAATLVGSVAVQHEALLQRQMRFAALTAIEVGAAITGTIAGVGLAVLGAGYWALVAQLATLHLTRSSSLWAVCRWRPVAPGRAWPGSEQGLGSLYSYGVHHAAARMLSQVGRTLDHILIGRFGGAAVLGLYSSAFRWSQFPFRMIYSPLVGVAVAGFSRVQHDPAAYRSHARRALEAVFAGSLPVLAFLFAEGPLVIRVLLGEQWRGAAPIFRVLCLAAFVVCVTRVTKWIYLSMGSTRRELHWAAISTPLVILGVVAGLPWGALGVAVGYTAAEVLLAYPAIAFCLRT
ncbi:MAG TPA: lipopolysaccharide biosynthesis protein, partial [Chloroflexota bacterium]|nr:lipopolysaccharide biosynthesis protein [Chloroflexota bacterium]